MSSLTEDTLNYLISNGKIPLVGAFEVTSSLIQDYFFTYGALSNKVKGVSNKSNFKYARRLAGLSLLRLNISRGVRASEIKAGHCYLISNKAFPLHYKLGASYDVHKRLASYQTYSPYRDFVLEKYDFVLDKLKVEKIILNHPMLVRGQG